VQLDPIGSISGSNRWDWGWDWWQARTASIPGSEPMWLTTMSETGKEGIHDFHESTYFLKHPTFTENTKGRFLTHAPSQSKLISYTHADEFTLAGAQRDKRLPAPSTTKTRVETICVRFSLTLTQTSCFGQAPLVIHSGHQWTTLPPETAQSDAATLTLSRYTFCCQRLRNSSA
jgi:hypothetical protein